MSVLIHALTQNAFKGRGHVWVFTPPILRRNDNLEMNKSNGSSVNLFKMRNWELSVKQASYNIFDPPPPVMHQLRYYALHIIASVLQTKYSCSDKDFADDCSMPPIANTSAFIHVFDVMSRVRCTRNPLYFFLTILALSHLIILIGI